MYHAGVLYYGDQAANGVKASDFVTELHSKADLDNFINKQPDNVLTVIDVCLRNAAPCIHIFPAVLALAKNFTGFAHFARLIGDESDEAQHLLKELKVNEVPEVVHCVSNFGCCSKQSQDLSERIQNMYVYLCW